MKKKKAVTLTEVLIALSIGATVLLPVTIMFSNSGRVLEKSSNLGIAAGLARYIIQGMMSMRMNEIISIPIPGVSCCDDSNDNLYLRYIFHLKENCGSLEKGLLSINHEQIPKLYSRLAKYEFRYSVTVSETSPSGEEGDLMKSVSVLISWKEFGVNKVYESHAYIVPR